MLVGKHSAKIKDYGVSTTSAGNPQVYIQFEFSYQDDNGATVAKTLTWYGSFVGGAKEITEKTLIYCGLMPQNFANLINLKQGVASNLLDTNRQMEIDVQQEPKQGGSGMRTVVQWVNNPEMAPQVKKIDDALNTQYFGQYGQQFAGDLNRLATEMGLMNGGGNQNMNTQNNQMQNVNTMGNQQSFNQNQNQNMNQNQNQNNGQQNFNQQNNGQNMNQNQNQNMNQNQGNQGNNGAGFKAPF